MKKFLYSMLAMLMIAATTTLLTSCSNDDSGTVMIFSLTQKRNSYTGRDVATYNAYVAEVMSAYRKALGLANGESDVTITSGSYSSKRGEMKSKFEGAKLPEEPEINGSYAFTVAIMGRDLSGNSSAEVTLDEIASKTFTND